MIQHYFLPFFFQISKYRTEMFSLITECTGFIFVKVDLVACPRNGLGMISWMRSTLRIYRSSQTAGDYIIIITVMSEMLSLLPSESPSCHSNNTSGGPGYLIQWRRGFGSSCSCIPIITIKIQHIHLTGLNHHLYMKIHIKLSYDQWFLLVTERLLWYL